MPDVYEYPACRVLTIGAVRGGVSNAIGDYRSAPVDFAVESERPGTFSIARVIVYLESAGGMKAQDYGKIKDGLPNGIRVLLMRNGSVVEDLTDGLPVRKNAGWGRVCYDVSVNGWGSGNDFLVARWTFTQAGVPVVLTEGTRLTFRLQDDFRSLVAHHFMAQGYHLNKRM